MANEVVNTPKTWLIKSSTRVLGPFTTAEVTELLKTRQVSIIDEIRLPQSRWQYIRENKMFMEIVRNIRDEQDAQGDLTMTQSIAQYSSITKTDAVANLPDDLTPAPAAIDRSQSSIRDVTPPQGAANTTSTSAPVTKSYGASGDARLQQKIQQKSNTFRGIVLAVAVVVSALIFFNLQQKERMKGAGYDEVVSQAIRYKNLGLYEKSLQAYYRAAKIKNADSELQLQMAPVLISEDKQSLVGRRILEAAIMKEGAGRAEVLDAYLGIAVSYMIDGDLKQAEDVLQKAIGYEPYNVSALMNLAIIQEKKGNYSEAMRGFQEIYKKNPHTVLALLGQAMATVDYTKATADNKFLPALISEINSAIKKTSYLRQELLLFLVYANNLMGDVDSMNQSVIQFLNQNTGQSARFLRPLTVDWRFSQWDNIEKYCSETYQKSSSHPELKSLRAVCLMEVNREGEAGKLLQEALAEAPKDPYVLLAQAGYLNKLGRVPEALAVLKLPELQTLPLKNLLVGQICINTQDTQCAYTAFNSAHNQDSNSAFALYGMAWALQKSDHAKAYEYVRSGLQIEPNYLPLIELRDTLEFQ